MVMGKSSQGQTAMNRNAAVTFTNTKRTLLNFILPIVKHMFAVRHNDEVLLAHLIKWRMGREVARIERATKKGQTKKSREEHAPAAHSSKK